MITPTASLHNTDITNILNRVFKDHKEQIPTDCKPITGGTVVNVCNNGTDPLLDIKQLTINPYPLVPGHITFKMIYNLKKEIPEGTILKLNSFSKDGESIFEGELDFCDYSSFARIFCPVEPTDKLLEMEQVLEVPDDVPSGIYSFFVSALNPQGEMFTNIAANIEIDNEKVRVHGDDL